MGRTPNPQGARSDERGWDLQLDPADVPPLEQADENVPRLVAADVEKKIDEDLDKVAAAAAAEADGDDFSLAGANDYRPSSLAVTFRVDVEARTYLRIALAGARYERFGVTIEGHPRDWFVRRPCEVIANAVLNPELSEQPQKLHLEVVSSGDLGPLSLDCFAFSRPQFDGTAIVTVGVTNRTSPPTPDTAALFQAELTVSAAAADGAPAIVSYPEAQVVDRDEEEESLRLLYRHYPTFAIGHGCAANWDSTSESRVSEVRGESLPRYEAPSITSDIASANGQPLVIPMAPLAGLIPDDDGFHGLELVVSGYADWIDRKQSEMSALPSELQAVAKRHLDECTVMLDRMRSGLHFLRSDERALQAFRLANHAVLLQQIRAGAPLRAVEYDAKAKRLTHSSPYTEPDPLSPPSGRGSWRPFQIAFLLAAVESTVDGSHADRETVDLIFFPTGGGKTEAYLGLSAFSIFHRRLTDPTDVGTQILMRYTLRLLTAQQFQRASALICAMEALRWENEGELGATPFRIGIWVGGDSAPNHHEEARKALRDLESGDRYAVNPFLVIRCPWCSAQIGPYKHATKGKAPSRKVTGYQRVGSTVGFYCSDNRCDFSESLPIVVVDDDVYELRPDLVIGTVDKFAQLAWEPRSRALFGVSSDGTQLCSPPGLIIQDELHLISGPLGSMVGLYEAVIEDLCTNRAGGVVVRPKIVSSTATIRRSEQQVMALFARPRTALFPPRGLDIADSFFAQYAVDDEGQLLPGRRFLGIHAPGLGSMQTVQVRTFTALLQAGQSLPEGDARDPWWTLLSFFNSLRELGTSLSLLQSDIPDYLKTTKNRTGVEWSDVRHLYSDPLELTGRLRAEEVPEAIAKLERRTTDDYPVDVCLASNIIEVGVDIDRLSLLAVVGQPKTTSQYIQVAGRIGRRWWERPGLVVMLYGAAKPRDRSHFEKFRTYHERLYAQVEPTSVTPFSPPVIDRALRAAVVAYVRQRGAIGDIASPYPPPASLIAEAEALLAVRAGTVDPEERSHLLAVLEQIRREWDSWGRTAWTKSKDEPNSFLLRQYGAYIEPRLERTTWPLPMSLRNVDAECDAVVTQLYAIAKAEAGGPGGS